MTPASPATASTAASTSNHVGAFQPREAVTVLTETTVCADVGLAALVPVVGDVVVVVAWPLATAPAAADAPEAEPVLAGDDDPTCVALVCGAVLVPAVVGVEAVALLPAEEVEPPAATKRPVRFQNAEKPLNGPPTTWLDHCRV